jgi:hypothetical protein
MSKTKSNFEFSSLDEMFGAEQPANDVTGISAGIWTTTVTAIKFRLSKKTQKPMYSFTVTHNDWPQDKEGNSSTLTGYAMVEASGTLTSARQLFEFIGVTSGVPVTEDPELNLLDVMIEAGILEGYPRLKVEVANSEMRMSVFNHDTQQDEDVVTPSLNIKRILKVA